MTMLNLNYQHQLPVDFHRDSRVWIYQASRPLVLGEALDVESMFQEFIVQWQSHGTPVKGYANLFFGQFIVLMADETQASVSGCSTDSSVRFIREVESRFNITLFDRQSLAFIIRDKVQSIPLSQVGFAINHGFIDADTIYFNNIVATKWELAHQWLIPVKDSWLATRFPILNSYA